MNQYKREYIRLHMTNVVGLGAVRLLQSLLPSMINERSYKIKEVYVPANDEFSNCVKFDKDTAIISYKRYLPNSISRLLECTLFGKKFSGTTPLLVFGDIPIRCKAKQTVFVQTPLLVKTICVKQDFDTFKYRVSRWLFRRNMRYAADFIVQTEKMKTDLIDNYPEIKNRIHVIAQPAPEWLIKAEIERTDFHSKSTGDMRLFYPAAFYPHKNHRILSKIKDSSTWPISELILTVSQNLNPNKSIPWIHCVGKLEPDGMINIYRKTDVLLFLSLAESFGFPLVEAMWIGLPIICPDLPYAKKLCGDQAIYFNPEDVNSLRDAVNNLKKRLSHGWQPDWSISLKKIPHSWNEVASAILQLASLFLHQKQPL